MPPRIRTYVEIGAKRTFAAAIEWPGWSRSAREEDTALETLCSYGSRYARVLRGTRLGFEAPADPSAFTVLERLEGDATTDFGAPSIAPKADGRRITDTELRRLRTILRACWRSFDRSVDAARGAVLARGPRGGGRDLGKIVDHVVGAEVGYLGGLGWRVGAGSETNALDRTRSTVLEALEHAVREGVPAVGPRGGRRWLPRYFVRRVAWHVLDHAWEIGDRVT